MDHKTVLIAFFFLLFSIPSYAIIDKHAVYDNGQKIKLVKRKISVRPTATGYGIQYHGGAVMTGPVKIYYIWYGNFTGTTTPAILTDFGNSIGGSDWFNILTTYSTNTAKITNAATIKGQVFDNYTYGSALTDLSVYKIVKDKITSAQLPADPTGVYFVLSSKDVSETSGFCKSYCGFHTYNYILGKPIVYAYVGDPGRCLSTCATQAKISPNNNPAADAMVSSVAHELAESISNPYFNAWYDITNKENADKCTWNYGARQLASNGSFWNVETMGHKFYIHNNWINVQFQGRNGYCGGSYP